MHSPQRPAFESITNSQTFKQWYWLKTELVAICKQSGLPYAGAKATLMERIAYALDHQGAVQPNPKAAPKPASRFNWAKATLSPQTPITDNISFGPNFRRFMTQQIGPGFTCTSEFMAWVKAHPGHTLQAAIDHWHTLAARHQDPAFKRPIAPMNMYNQYMRDFLAHYPDKGPADARHFWLLKKLQPTTNGRVQFAPADVQLT